jgi:YD repeat-containing protein
MTRSARLVRRVAADGGEQLKAYDDQGRLIAEQDALGAVTEYRYDDVGRLLVADFTGRRANILRVPQRFPARALSR